MVSFVSHSYPLHLTLRIYCLIYHKENKYIRHQHIFSFLKYFLGQKEKKWLLQTGKGNNSTGIDHDYKYIYTKCWCTYNIIAQKTLNIKLQPPMPSQWNIFQYLVSQIGQLHKNQQRNIRVKSHHGANGFNRYVQNFHPIKTKYTSFSAAHESFSKTGSILGHEVSLQIQNVGTILAFLLLDHSGKKLEINSQKLYRNYTNTWKLNNIIK